MSTATTTNVTITGQVVQEQIPARVVERGGQWMATVGRTIPIHRATSSEVEQLAPITHHYCGIFTEELFAPLGEVALVRIDADRAEKVYINRDQRLLLVSSDGRLAQWRSTSTFQSNNQFMAGTPIHNDQNQLASVVVAKRGQHYAVSNFEGDGGYFDTSRPWEILDIEKGKSIYGNKSFTTRDALRDYLQSLPPAVVGPSSPPRPILWRGERPRLLLVTANGRQLSHHYLSGVFTDSIIYI